MRFCIIGAGAAGLCAARHVAAAGWTPVVYELTGQLGGTWVYTDQTERDDYGQKIHSSMYTNLVTNLPKEIMNFPDFPFWKDGRSFVHHTKMLEYLNIYATNFGLHQYIQFLTRVDLVRPEEKRWKVSVTDVLSKQTEESVFDAVFVCNGHYSTPLIPDIPGLEDFKENHLVLHSHVYRTAQPFANKNVAVLGAAASGVDIGLEIAAFAKKVYICHNKPAIVAPLPPNMEQCKGIAALTSDSASLTDDETIDIDALLFCTGYKYDFPFFPEDFNLKVEDERITPLYQHLVHIDYPNSLFFIGLQKTILPFPMFDTQVRFGCEMVKTPSKLPSREVMLNWQDTDYKARLAEGLPRRKAHFFASRQWEYHRELARIADLPDPVPEVVEKLYEKLWTEVRKHDLVGYKRGIWRLANDKEYEYRGKIGENYQDQET